MARKPELRWRLQSLGDPPFFSLVREDAPNMPTAEFAQASAIARRRFSCGSRVGLFHDGTMMRHWTLAAPRGSRIARRKHDDYCRMTSENSTFLTRSRCLKTKRDAGPVVISRSRKQPQPDDRAQWTTCRTDNSAFVQSRRV